MKEPVYVTEVISGDTPHPTRHIMIPLDEPPKTFEERVEWQLKNRQLIEYSVKKEDAPEARGLTVRLFEAKQRGDRGQEDAIVKSLLELRVKDQGEMSDQEKWDSRAIQKPGDWGPASWEKKDELKELITQHCRGRVLEPMCGFRSYVLNSPDISEVVALDFSRKALERYDHPERKRILYNLEDVVNGDRMEFFEDKTFNAISANFAIDYLTNPVPVHEEFYRILANDGQVLVVDGPGQGYVDIKKRIFDPKVCAKHMQAAGFATFIEPLPAIKLPHECEGYFLVQGKKAEK
jgi:SAM-dependent methyltransferase